MTAAFIIGGLLILACWYYIRVWQENGMAETPLIMLVDDDADFISLNRHILESKGYRVESCFSPQEAIKAIEKKRPDLIITDLMMKELSSGFSFAYQLKENPQFADIPIIIVTAVSSKMGFDFRPHTPEELTAMHVDAYFDKPVQPQKLLDKVTQLLGTT
jgi:CheY-like chemotaxis protein